MGSNEFSWGWDLGRNKAYHDSKNKQGSTYPANLRHDETFVVPDKFLGETTFIYSVTTLYSTSASKRKAKNPKTHAQKTKTFRKKKQYLTNHFP